MKKILATLSILGAILAASPAAALTYKSVTRTNGYAAVAIWQTEEDSVYTYTYLEVDKTKAGSDLVLVIETFDENTDSYTCRFGQFITNTSIITFNKLNSAVLTPQTVSLLDCDTWLDAGTATIAVSWTGVGIITKGRLHVHSVDGDFSENFSGQSAYRNAATSAATDLELGSLSYAYLVQFRSMDMFTVK